ncbi:DUF885 family protein [bacterium]|nr:DUF885 family protein [bacterium]
MKTSLYPFLMLLLIVSLVGSFYCQKKETITADGTYQDLVEFFKEWREFEKPNFKNGVPDYTAEAMAEQESRIPEFEKRLAAMDTSDWTISQKVDYEIVRAEINGLKFNHQVLKPWSRNPLFYAVVQMHEQDVPAREGPEIDGVLNVFQHRFPLNEESQAVFKKKLTAIPSVLAQAQKNLVHKAGDLWFFGIRQKKGESADLAALAERFEGRHPELTDLALEAKSAVDDFTTWLEEKQKGMKSFSGIGKEEYSRYMKKVHLVPYSWEEQMELIQRELERSLAALKMEEHRNRDLPQLQPPQSLKERKEQYKNSVAKFMKFLRSEEIFSVPEYMHLDDEVGSFTPPKELDFFSHISYRDPLPLLCHQVHWLEKQRMARNTHPIRGKPLLYNIWDSRAEGLATGFEELMMQAGLLEDRPRARELTHIMLAFRAIRAIGGLKLHSGEWTLEEAVDYAVEKTPRGFVSPDSRTIYGDYALYLSQPGYGTSYVIGKLQLDRLIKDRALQLGDEFRLKDFFDEYFSLGMIPASLIRWEMTGLDDQMKKLWE